MSGTIGVEPDPAFPGGHALLRVRGAGKFAGPAGFWIKRDDYDEGVFGPRGWQVADALLTPDGHSVEGNDLLLHIGPAVVQHLDSAVYRIGVPAVGVETNVFWPDLPLLAGDALNMVAEPAAAEARATPEPNPKILRPGPETQAKRPEPVATPHWRDGTPAAGGAGPDATVAIKPPPPGAGQPVPPVDAEPEKRNWLPVTALLLAVLAVAGGGGYFGYHWLFPPAQEDAGQSPPATPPSGAPPAPEQPPAGPDLSRMSAAEALRSGASPEALVQEAQRRMQLDGPQRSEALLLLQGAADRNYAPANAALGRLYDPGIPHPPDIQPDARQAASRYRLAVNGGDTSVADARASLQAYLQQQASHGNMFAPLILKEFWP